MAVYIKSPKKNALPIPKISTMTYIAECSNLKHSVKTYYDACVDKEIDDDLYIENKDNKKTKKGKFVKSFGNQMTIKSKSKKFNVKLFYNKRIQITGVKSEEDVQSIFQKLCDLFDFTIHSEKMVMKNLALKISPNTINLYNLYDKLKTNHSDVTYTPEIYPGLKFKTGNSTALTFATGNVIISTKDDNEVETIIRTLVENI